MIRPTPAVLVIASGFGLSPVIDGNALRAARMPAFLHLVEAYPAMALLASGTAVGLAEGVCGSSRHGCATIGAGRAIFGVEERIRAAAATQTFNRVPALRRAFESVRAAGGTVHLIGSVGDDAVSQGVLRALLHAATSSSRVALHLVLGGGEALAQVEAAKAIMGTVGFGTIASIAGAAYAADRDHAWERARLAYEAIVNGAPQASSLEEVIEAAATCAEDVPPAAFGDTRVRAGDACIFFNRTPAATRGLASALALPSFGAFPRAALKQIRVVTFVDVGLDFPVETAFPPLSTEGTLSEALSNAGMRQLCISETEGFACVTSGMSGMDAAFPGETRIIIPGPGVSRLDRVPDLSSSAIADRTVKEIAHGRYDAIIAYLPAPSRVARTGDEPATVKACEAADRAIGRITEAALALDGVCFLVSDHGAAEAVHERMRHGHHACAGTANPVPFVIIGRAYEGLKAPSGDLIGGDLANATPSGTLADVAPTILRILGFSAPKEMTGNPLI